MALMKWSTKDAWEPLKDLEELHQQINRVFGRSLLEPPFGREGDGGRWAPRVDITEDKDAIVVKTDLPGMRQEDIAVEVEGDILTIRGERTQEAESSKGQVHRTECSYGEFLRSFTLPSMVDAAKVQAAYRQGVLEVRLPKREGAVPKQVKIEVK